MCLVATLCFCLCAGTLLAQHGYRLKGTVADTASGYKLPNATIYVLRARDSMLVNFTYAAADGSFAINALPAGHFILLMTNPDYADYAETFMLDDTHTVHDFRTVAMQSKARLLQEVIVKGQVRAIRIKGDTTEFNPKAYVIQPNDKVEDLLRQLPGLQVDKNGKITASGEVVTKVLLDGEEFFGDDPTLVTRNIRADMVDKIQLYDKKSDQAAFTGIDDGVKIKTINVQLKEDKNTGAFGKTEAGAGTSGFYQAQALYNRFKPGVKYAAYATVANTGKISLGKIDDRKLGGTSNAVQVGDVIALPATATDDQDGAGGYNGKGLPAAHTGGVHYDSRWAAGRESINANYKAGWLGVTGVNTIQTEQNLPTGVISSNTSRVFDNAAFRQKLDAVYQISIDSSSALKIAADVIRKNIHTASHYGTTTTKDSVLLNRNTRSLDNNEDVSQFNASALYTKKLPKAGRTFSWNVNGAYSRSADKGYQHSAIDFYSATGSKDSTQQIDQYKTTGLISAVVSSNMTYSEPLSKRVALVVNYGLGVNNSSANRKSFNQSAPGKYDLPDNAYSNDYRFDQLTHQVGAIFTYKKTRSLLNFGTKVSYFDFKQVDVYIGDVYRRNFINWAPQASYQYTTSQQKNLSVNYNGNTVQPTIYQIQPVRVNNDPLNITLGNPRLRPAFTNRLTAYYHLYKPLTGHYINFSGSYSLTSSAIVNNTFTDATGKTSVQYINLAGKTPYSYTLGTEFGLTIQPIDVSVGIELYATGSYAWSYINNVLNTSKNYSYWASIQLQKNVQKRYSLFMVVGPSYAVSEFSLQQRNNNAAGFYAEGRASFYLPGKLQVESGITYSYNAATQTLAAVRRSIWNASLGRTFLKNDNLKLSLSANDLLNDNVNFSRNVTANAIRQSSYTSIKRYCMLSLVWDFTRFGTQPVKK